MKIKNIIISLIIFSLLGIFLSFIPVWGWFFDFFHSDTALVSQLLVTTPRSSATIYIDGKLKGKTEADKQFTISNIGRGNHNIKIDRISDPDHFYIPFEKNLDFVPSTAVQINWSAGPSVESSSGFIKYFKKQIEDSSTKARISVYPSDSSITVDSAYSNGEYIINDIKSHKIVIGKTNYFGQDINILMTKSNGERIVGYDLIVEVYLYKNPIPDV